MQVGVRLLFSLSGRQLILPENDSVMALFARLPCGKSKERQ
jgi:hypothetical protein